MSVLIIGFGFVGSNTAALLAERGYDAHAVDINPRVPDYVGDAGNIEVSRADAASIEQLSEKVSKIRPRLMVHTAISPLTDLLAQAVRVNITGLANTLELARRYDSRIIYLSSGAVYGQLPGSEEPITEEESFGPIYPIRENDLTWAPIYTLTKRVGESLVELANKVYGLEATILRLGLVYGQGDTLANAGVTLLLRRALARRPLILDRGGDTFCPLVYVKDVASAVLKAAEAEQIMYGVFNIADRRGYTLHEVAETIKQITSWSGVKIGPGIWPARNTPIPRGVISWPTSRRLDISKASRLLGYTPRYMLREGLSEYAAWMQKNWSLYSPSTIPFPDDR